MTLKATRHHKTITTHPAWSPCRCRLGPAAAIGLQPNGTRVLLQLWPVNSAASGTAAADACGGAVIVSTLHCDLAPVHHTVVQRLDHPVDHRPISKLAEPVTLQTDEQKHSMHVSAGLNGAQHSSTRILSSLLAFHNEGMPAAASDTCLFRWLHSLLRRAARDTPFHRPATRPATPAPTPSRVQPAQPCRALAADA